MRLDDFVMLGTTVPEPKKDGRIFVCSAGVSPELRQLIRVYPLARRHVPHRWDMHRIALERNPQDPRPASWKIAGDRSTDVHPEINDRFEQLGTIKPHDRISLLRPYVVGSIKEANARKMSLAIIHPDSIETSLEHNPDSPDSPQLSLFDRPGEPPSGAKRFAWMPRINFHDELGWNRLMLRDWGTFELQRKHGPDYFQKNYRSALHLDENSSLLVGNILQHQNSWLVISVLNGIREAPTLLDLLADQREAISDKVRYQVYERDGWQCIRCGSTDDLTLHHIHPHSRGGTNELGNLQTLCRSCNSSLGDSLPPAGEPCPG